jgi:putative transposase
MDDYESLSHTAWECKYHVVFIPKCVMCRNLLPHCHEPLPQISQNLARYAHLFTRATLAEMG